MTLQTILTYVAEAAAVIGPLGSVLEAAGNAFKIAALVALGQKLEAIGVDLPELLGGAKAKAVSK